MHVKVQRILVFYLYFNLCSLGQHCIPFDVYYIIRDAWDRYASRHLLKRWPRVSKCIDVLRGNLYIHRHINIDRCIADERFHKVVVLNARLVSYIVLHNRDYTMSSDYYMISHYWVTSDYCTTTAPLWDYCMI